MLCRYSLILSNHTKEIWINIKIFIHLRIRSPKPGLIFLNLKISFVTINSLKSMKLWIGMNFEPNRIFHVFWAVFGHEDDQSFKIERKIYLQQGPQIKNYFKFIYLHTVGWNDGLVWVWISWASSQHFVDNCYFVQLFCSFLTSCFDDYLIFSIFQAPRQEISRHFWHGFLTLYELTEFLFFFFSFRKDRSWKILDFVFWFDKNFLLLIFLICFDVTYRTL